MLSNVWCLTDECWMKQIKLIKDVEMNLLFIDGIGELT